MSDYITAAEARRIRRNNRAALHLFAADEAYRRKQGAQVQYSIMRDDANVAEFDGLKTWFYTDAGIVKAVDGVSFDVPRGKTVGIVGESGCGKSITSLSLMRLLAQPQGQIVAGAIRLNVGTNRTVIDVTKAFPETMQQIRGNQVAMIFQEPMTSLNPVLRIGHQVDEALLSHGGAGTSTRARPGKAATLAAKERTLELLSMVGISDAAAVYNRYPHELSGGMVQRVMISMALSCAPSLIIADEPTTALDVTIQAQILDLLRNLKDRIHSSIMLITHDLGVVAGMADFVVVMYAGRVVERGTARDIFNTPAHPYTIGLMRSKPVLNHAVPRLYSIPGKVPNPVHLPNYCYFRDRCDRATAACNGAYPAEVPLSPTHAVSCYKGKSIK